VLETLLTMLLSEKLGAPAINGGAPRPEAEPLRRELRAALAPAGAAQGAGNATRV